MIQWRPRLVRWALGLTAALAFSAGTLLVARPVYSGRSLSEAARKAAKASVLLASVGYRLKKPRSGQAGSQVMLRFPVTLLRGNEQAFVFYAGGDVAGVKMTLVDDQYNILLEDFGEKGAVIRVKPRWTGRYQLVLHVNTSETVAWVMVSGYK